MVAQINSQYLQQMGNFQIDRIFRNGRDTLQYLRSHPVDLVILDVYMPGISGIELLRQMRTEGIRSSVIMVTAATEVSTVDEALRLGIVDYLIKPFTFQRFHEAIRKYISKTTLLKQGVTVDQSMVDQLLPPTPPAKAVSEALPKGLNQNTLSFVYEVLQNAPSGRHTCESLSQVSGLSKVTVRRYLNYLLETGRILSSIDYETGGRPRVIYQLK